MSQAFASYDAVKRVVMSHIRCRRYTEAYAAAKGTEVSERSIRRWIRDESEKSAALEMRAILAGVLSSKRAE